MKREYDFSKAKRGPVVKPVAGKTRITIRLDNAVLDWFRSQAHKAGGANYQSMVNEALKQHIESAREPLATTLRRVLREELRKAGWPREWDWALCRRGWSYTRGTPGPACPAQHPRQSATARPPQGIIAGDHSIVFLRERDEP